MPFVEYEGILQNVGFDVPTWAALAQGAHPFNPEGEEDSTAPRTGWQRPTTSRLHEQCISEMWPAFSDTEKALMLSQSCPMSGEPFTCFPSQSFRLLLLRRLRLSLPFTARRCRCGRPLDSSGHHRAACARVGVLGRRGFALESAAARVCREAGGKVMTNILVRDMDCPELVGEVVPSLSSSLRKWADVGLPRRHSSSARWQRQKQLRRQSSCKRPWRMHGATGGEGCWRAPRRKLSPVLCWNTALLSQPQEWSRRCTT